MLRSYRVPHTDKRPERCPHCGSTHVIRKGMRKKKIEIVQLWRCASCKRVFTPAPEALRDKTYPLHVVLDAITLYNLGYSPEQVAEKIRSRFGRRAGRSTIAAWLAEPFAHHVCAPSSRRAGGSSRRRRLSGRSALPPADLQVRLSPAEARHAARGREHARFAGVADFLERCRPIALTNFSATASAPHRKPRAFSTHRTSLSSRRRTPRRAWRRSSFRR